MGYNVYMLLGAKGQKLYYRDGKRVAFKNLTPEELEFLTPTKVVAPPRLARTRVRIVGEPTLERLPDEILEQVALHLDLKSLSSLCKACFPIFLVRKENLFWKKRLRQDYGVEVELPLVFPQIGKRFQEFYQEVKPYLKKDMDSDWNDHTTHWGNPMLKINLTFETYEQVYRYLSLLEYRYTHRAYPPRVQTALSQYIGMVLRFCKKPRKKVSGEVSAEDYLQCKIDPQLDPFIQVLNPRGHILGEVAWYISGFFLFYPFGLLLELKEFQPFFQGVNGSQSPRYQRILMEQLWIQHFDGRTNRIREDKATFCYGILPSSYLFRELLICLERQHAYVRDFGHILECDITNKYIENTGVSGHEDPEVDAMYQRLRDKCRSIVYQKEHAILVYGFLEDAWRILSLRRQYHQPPLQPSSPEYKAAVKAHQERLLLNKETVNQYYLQFLNGSDTDQESGLYLIHEEEN